MAGSPKFTVFTPTYNRAHTIKRAYDSLCAQTLRDFEWLVVDDGSTDNTSETIAKWTEVSKFPIRYLKQNNGGKHIAHNRALAEARGYFFAILDSDDALVPDALENLDHLWRSIPEREQKAFCSVGGLCRDQHGAIVGDKFPTDPFDADMREIAYVHRIRGEKWIGWVTELARRYPFPEISGTYIPEGLFCFDISKTFKTRWSNDVLRIYYIDDSATGSTITKVGWRGRHAKGRWHYYIWLLDNDLEYFFQSPMPFIKAAAALPICAWYCGRTLKESLRALTTLRARLLVLAMLPAAVVLVLKECFRERALREAPAKIGSTNFP
jgi:glycosyltransferase involved in cell wall biosynthesis